MSTLCPICQGEVHTEAWACRHCGGHLGFVRPLLDKVSILEAELESLKTSSTTFTSDLPCSNVPTRTGQESPKLRITARRVAVGALTTISVLLVLHAVLLFVYDLQPIVLRFATLLTPAVAAWLTYRCQDFIGTELYLVAALVAIAGVVGMLGITASLDNVPVLPQSIRDWKETLEYALAIALGYAAGGQLARWMTLRGDSFESKSLLVLLFDAQPAGKRDIAAIADRLNQLFNSLAPIVTGALSLYSGFRAFFGV